MTFDDDDFDPDNPFPEPVTIEITDVFDLHTIAPRDVRRAIEAYLDEARRLNFRVVRIIHGKGIGVQRRAVREVLAATPFVREWFDAPPHAGGLGATIVHFN
ncbi:MAG TPA: Smr/MutS family protein [Pyrinomonadaceae bacterium]|nr:Smr/MutS family protein [Pyrinomonadaceae bacterium]